MDSYIDGEVLSIQYDISINGTQLDFDRKQCITSIAITESDEDADTATINVSDPEKIFIEDDIFVEEVPIHIEIGWSNTTYRATFDGYISELDIDFASDGIPKITLKCTDETHEANTEKNDNVYENTTSADIVKELCEKNGWDCVIEENYDFPVKESFTQADMTDIEFMKYLAENETVPFTARLDSSTNTFYYEKKGDLEEEAVTLHYGEYPHEIISFSPSLDKESSSASGVESATMDSSTKEIDEAEAEPEEEEARDITYDSGTGKWSDE